MKSLFRNHLYCVHSGLLIVLLQAALGSLAWAAALEAKPEDPYFAKYAPLQAPAPGGLLLKEGDRLAICGDSITEQKMYSRLIETYLTVCVPELRVTARQYGWSGETADGFLRRMTNDCLRFKPTVATTCYGMNDYRYRPYEEAVARAYRENYGAVARAFKAAGVRVVLGSPGCVGKVASWVKPELGTLEEHNLHLCALRNIDVEIAAAEETRFADLFWPMLTAGFEARKKYGADYAVSGKDGVHPGWAGQLIMARGYLKAMGLDGNLGVFTVDWAAGSAKATAGHTVESYKDGVLTVTSRRYPFCATGELDKDSSLRSGMSLVPFNAELNRLTLQIKGGAAANYKVTWGKESKTYPAAQLAAGVNLAEDFQINPFSDAFKKVDEAVAAKQSYETRQVQQLFHGPEGSADMALTAAVTEKAREKLVVSLQSAFVPVTHSIRIEPQ